MQECELMNNDNNNISLISQIWNINKNSARARKIVCSISMIVSQLKTSGSNKLVYNALTEDRPKTAPYWVGQTKERRGRYTEMINARIKVEHY